MKTYWDIDIDNKIASFKDDEIVFKARFELEADESIAFNFIEVLENNEKIDIMKMNSYMKYFSDEINLLHFNEKLKFDGQSDIDGIKMYCIEDNIYVDEEGVLNVFEDNEFHYTDYYVDIVFDNMESTPKALVKLSVYFDDEESEDENDEVKYIVWNEVVEVLKQ